MFFIFSKINLFLKEKKIIANKVNVNNAKDLLSKSIKWLQKNYEGINDWEILFEDCISMYEKFQDKGRYSFKN